jgi:peptidoglycan/LPS O-acetylase OafA/YrhL
LRALAAGSILVYHAWIDSSPSGVQVNLGPLTSFMPDLAFGVTLFFVLSGFLLYGPFAAAVLRDDRLPQVSKYFRNRALRILPAYWVILLLVALVLQSAFIRDSQGNLDHGALTAPWALVANVLFLQNYRLDTFLTGIGPAWSLAVEVVFYLVLPVLALLALALGKRAVTHAGRRLAALTPAIVLLVVGLTGKATAAFFVGGPGGRYSGFLRDWHSVIERSFWCQADLFAFGMALAVLKVEVDQGVLRLPRKWRPAAVGGALVAYLATAHGTTQFGDRLGSSLYSTLMAFAFALVVGLAVLPTRVRRRPTAFVRVLETRPLVFAGVISYSIFLWHQPIIFWLHDRGLAWDGRSGFAANLLLTVLLVVALSTLTWRYVERPALRLKARTRSSASPGQVPVEQLEAAP